MFRVDPQPVVRWYDLDYPEVIGLRQRLLPARGSYHLAGCAVTDPGWLGDVPTDRPVTLQLG